MKKIIVLLSILFLSSTVLANGVCIGNAVSGAYLKLNSSSVKVNVESQVAITTVDQVFVNAFTADTVVKYAFPITDKQSAIKLRWKIYGEWREAQFSAIPQDTTLPGPGGQILPSLKTYLGNTALYFPIPQRVMKDSTLEVELTYVEFLPYSFGNVDFVFKNNYQLIQTTALITQALEFNLKSQRHIDSLFLLSHSGGVLNNYGDSANISFALYEQPANADYKIRYSLSLSQLGLFGMSTFLSDSASVADTINGGYFLFVAEPAPSTTVINKVFTLIIDRSGSMSGDKIVQARNAAKFIVNNLNTGDKFNIVDFSDVISSFRPSHVPFDETNKQAAIDYINTLQANGMTNISGAFSTAIPQFASTDTNTANIIIFFTDGQATAGLTNTTEILNHIQSLVTTSERIISIFPFGIGSDANVQLLTLLASQNNGIADFLENSELEAKITAFYMKIRNPVLTNTSLTFTPSTIITETYPDPVPNLYKGQQLLIAGRYSENASVTVHLSGKAFGQNVNYDYPLTLADTSYASNQFLTKVWAKSKIENLTIQYYSLDPNSNEAKAIKALIIKLSLRYGVLSIFTSFNITVDVEFTSFNCIRTIDGVFLEWRTGSEMNNSGFFIERSFGNVDWTTIGHVQGNGSTLTPTTYNYKDLLKDIYYKGYISYRLRQIDFDGSIRYSKTIEVFVNTIPNNFSLEQNYPNPFNPSTKINYTLPVKEHVLIKVYDILGNEVKVLVNEFKEAGNYDVTFSASGLSSGVYIYRMEAGDFRSQKKLLFLK